MGKLAVSEKDASPYADAPLWTMRILDGSNRRMGTLAAREARYSPDGRWLAFTVGGYQGDPGALWVAASDGADPRRLLELSGKAVTSPRWSPDGNRIAYAELHRATQDTATWEVMTDGTGRHRWLPDWPERHAPAGWAADGRLLLVTGNGQLWTANPAGFFGSKLRPVQLTSGDVRFSSILARPSGATLYGVGTTRLGQLQRFDTHSRTWEPHLGGVSADLAEYSPDRRSVVYATHPRGELWTRQADGTHSIQLTKAPMRAGLGRWSPDGRTIAFPATSTPAEPWRIYLVNAAGGSPQPACPKECRANDLAWMPDGNKIVFSPPMSQYFSEPVSLRVLDIDTGEITEFPDSDGLFSPRLSPDRSRLLALAFGRENDRIRIYRFSDGAWSKSTSPGPGVPDWPAWSRDGESIWYYNVGRSEIRRHRLRDDRDELVLPLKVTEMTGLVGYWFNLTPDDEPMILRRRDIQEIYALDWTAR